MEVFIAKHGGPLLLGREGENNARQIRFDVSEWETLYGPGVVQLIVQRTGEDTPYPVPLSMDGSTAVWTVRSADTAVPGRGGKAELHYYVGATLAKSCIWSTIVIDALGEPSEEPPDPFEGWLEQILSSGAVAAGERIKAERAAVRSEDSAKRSEQSAAAASLSETRAEASEEAAALSAKKAMEAEGVKTVNGQHPDENGNVEVVAGVQSDWDQNDSTQLDFIKNRPFYEEVTEATGPLDFSWDGNLSGREYYVLTSDGEIETLICKISDTVLTMEDLSAGTVTLVTPDAANTVALGTDIPPADLQETVGVAGVGLFMEGEPMVVSVHEAGTLAGVNFTAGTYFLGVAMSGAVIVYISNLSNPDAVVTERTETVKKLDNKFIDAEWMATTYTRDITILENTVLDNQKEIGIGVTGAVGDEVVFVREGVEVTKPVVLDISLTALANENCFSTGGFSDAMNGNNTIPFVYWRRSSSATVVTPTADKTETWTIILRKKMYKTIPECFLPGSEPGEITVEVANGALSNPVVDKVIQKLHTGSRVILNYAGTRYHVIDANIDPLDGYGKMILSYAGAGLSGSHVTGGLYICYMTDGAGYKIRPLNTPSATFLSKSLSYSVTDYKLSIKEDGHIHVTNFDDETDTFALATKADLEAAIGTAIGGSY